MELKILTLSIILVPTVFFLTLVLYKFSYQRLKETNLHVKIFFWLPITLFFLFTITAETNIRILILAIIGMLMLYEFFLNGNRRLIWYPLIILLGLAHFLLFGGVENKDTLFIYIAFATVIADVIAFFFGNLGRLNLPAFINPNKKWEGVAGEILGAFLGILLLNYVLGLNYSWLLFLPIGIGAAVGDMVNSISKRINR